MDGIIEPVFTIPYISKTKNPNAGNCVYDYIYGPIKYTIYHSKYIPEFQEYVIVNQDDRVEYRTYKLEILEKIVLALAKYPSEPLSITRNIPTQRIFSLCPEEEYNYVYDTNYLVSCNSCNESFPVKELQETWSEWDDGSEAVCPKCGKWDCCQVKYQR